MSTITSEHVHICTCVCVCSVFHACLRMHVSMRPPICMCTVYMCAYLYVCTHVYVCVCVCIPVIKFLFPPQERPFCPDLSLRATAKRRHQEVRNCVYLQTSRSTYVKPIFTYFDLTKSQFLSYDPTSHQAAPFVWRLNRQMGGGESPGQTARAASRHCTAGPALSLALSPDTPRGKRKRL